MNQEDEDRLKRIRAMQCICCVIEDVAQPFRTEAHHLTDKGYRKHSGGHQSTLPLCKWHHRGICEGSPDKMLFTHGPSLELHKRKFIETYGTERQLLERINNVV